MKMINNIRYNLAKMIGGNTMNQTNENARKKMNAIYNIRNDNKLNDFLLENKIWLENDTDQLSEFYTGRNNFYFWNNTCINKKERGFKLFHFPTASLLNEKLNNVIFKGGVELPTNERLETIFKHNSFVDGKLPELTTNLNTYGGAFIKFGIDEDEEITIDVYDPLNVVVVKPARKIEEIHFINVYEKYTLKEIYGHGYINYIAYENKSGNEVGIDKIDSSLENIELPNEIMPALFIPNVGKNQYDKQQLLGKSKFDGLYSLFDEIDKQYSIISKEATASMTIEQYSEQSLMTISSQGENGIDVERVKPSPFMRSFTTYFDVDNNSTPQVTANNFNAQAYIGVIENLFNNVLQIYGISAQSLGSNSSSANASGKAKQEDEKATIDTRQEQIDKLTIVINMIVDKIIEFNNAMKLPDITLEEKENVIKFGQYKADDIEEWLNYLSSADVLDTVDMETKIEIVGKLFGFEEDKIKKITKEKLNAQEDIDTDVNESELLGE